jgi:uncharacterized membrane protein
MDSGRAQAFSDGVFAVAITLLVIDLLPVGSHELSTHVLLQAWPKYAAYVVSFLTIGIMWMNHHTIMGHVARVDRPVLVLNLLLLLGIVAIPFPTALVAEHLRDAGGGVAAVTYGIVMIAISFGFGALWIYIATHAGGLGAPVPREALLGSIPRFTGGLAGYLAGTVIAAVWSAKVAVAIYGALAVYYLFEHLPTPAGQEES